jgi:hypothetical protein
MTLKRKLEVDDRVFPAAKQLKLIPFPNMDLDTDVPMSDAERLTPDIVHSRLSSNASSVTCYESDSPLFDSPPSAFPSFTSSPSSFFTTSLDVHHSPLDNQVGLLQPKSAFVHHGSNCTQIPKLRVACASGVNGQRSMWTHCEQCGAISIVESD